ncbi:MerR family transcriptional regulator [Brachybacterium fresconis]|uniref:DNA-binding transcriptional MerR regulator n=1 Tax=Brachybacterium fresconis TaxID=173363 RepID=A0ABS4YI85_9MICO|nr:MerR family transcriptional regulator [Brachybacterium fresconis]MBP2408526.1 DNA-binding transcriptional MerR regulator [Brachybacterium fresconis]
MTETTVHDDLTVGRVADLVGVSVRTLHHWDGIGLVRPGGRSWSGYRLYDAEDIARIHRVLVYRELGLALAQIGRILDDPAVDPREHLQRQRTLLTERIRRLEKTAAAVDEMIERTDMNRETNVALSPEEQARIFGTDWDPAYQEEARERWGDTDAWKQSVARTGSWDAEQWQEVKDETDALEADLAAALGRGVEPGGEEANALAERHRASIDRHYDCSRAMQVVLARMYTEDPRFAAHYDQRAEGLAAWLRRVIEENARAHGVDPGTATWE